MRLGAHVSISGSLDLAVDRAVAIGADCLQIFYGSPRQWRIYTYPEEVLDRFVRRRRRARLDPLVAHAAYLVNLGSPRKPFLRRSVASLVATVRGVERLGGLAAVTHLGSRASSTRAAALRRASGALRQVLESTERAMVLVENGAGAGQTLGASIDDLAEVVGALEAHPRVGLCLDTAHLFAAGWDLRTAGGIDALVREIDSSVGWERVRLLHLNDSASALGSHLDRHANIGEGAIGLDGFRAIVNHPRLRKLPGVIETPGFNRSGPDRENLSTLRRLERGKKGGGR